MRKSMTIACSKFQDEDRIQMRQDTILLKLRPGPQSIDVNLEQRSSHDIHSIHI